MAFECNKLIYNIFFPLLAFNFRHFSKYPFIHCQIFFLFILYSILFCEVFPMLKWKDLKQKLRIKTQTIYLHHTTHIFYSNERDLTTLTMEELAFICWQTRDNHPKKHLQPSPQLFQSSECQSAHSLLLNIPK